MGRPLSLHAPANAPAVTRVVSLVPSETESVVALAGLSVLVGRTDYCHEPEGVRALPSVGGTKHFDVGAVLALKPDLVLANQEENGQKDVTALLDAGARVHLSFPRSLEGSRDYLIDLAALLGVDGSAAIEEADRALREAAAPAWRSGAPRVAVAIWRDPYMSLDERTFASSILEAAGAANAFSGRPRRYPLAADLDPSRAPIETGKDTRYPRFSIEELVARAPDVVLLPDEPYAFDASHARELKDALGHDRVALVSGKDLFWYGVRAAGAVGRIRSVLAELDPAR